MTLHLQPGLQLQGADIVGVGQSYDRNAGTPLVTVRLSRDAGSRMKAFTEAEIGTTVAFVVNGEVQTTPNIQAAITEEFAISAASAEEAERLKRILLKQSND